MKKLASLIAALVSLPIISLAQESYPHINIKEVPVPKAYNFTRMMYGIGHIAVAYDLDEDGKEDLIFGYMVNALEMKTKDGGNYLEFVKSDKAILVSIDGKNFFVDYGAEESSEDYFP